MRRSAALIAFMSMVLFGLPGASAGPQDGFASDNVEYVKFVPFEAGTATGARVIDKYLYVTSWKDFSIYDVSDPLNPELLSKTAFAEDTADEGTGFRFENEDVATNGKILIFSQQLPVADVFVYDIEDKTSPELIGHLKRQGGAHTAECLLDCKWLYGSNGNIIDLRDPTNPKLMDKKWGEGMPAESAHDVNEFAPGLVLTSSQPIMVLDARNPVKPKLLAVGDDEAITGGVHSNQWPRGAKDKIALFSSETNATGRCGEDNGAFMTWDASDYKKTHKLELLDIYHLQSGTWTDGSPGANGLGCSSHWFQEHPTFKNGGLVAMGAYEHGTRFVDVASNGKIKEVGWFVPNGGSTSAAYWLNKEIVYSVDYSRGLDILRFSDK